MHPLARRHNLPTYGALLIAFAVLTLLSSAFLDATATSALLVLLHLPGGIAALLAARRGVLPFLWVGLALTLLSSAGLGVTSFILVQGHDHTNMPDCHCGMAVVLLPLASLLFHVIAYALLIPVVGAWHLWKRSRSVAS